MSAPAPAPRDRSAAERPAKARVQEVFRALSRYVRNARMFSPEHPSCLRFIDTVEQNLLALTEQRGFLYLELGPRALTLDGEEVLAAGAPGMELLEGMYAEGARTFTFEKGLSGPEVRRFAALASTDWSRRSAYEEDLITATWRAELEHIHIEIADRFALAEEGATSSGAGADFERAAGQGVGKGGAGDSLQLRDLNLLLDELRHGAPSVDELVRMRQEELALFVQLREELDQRPAEAEVEDLVGADAQARSELNRQVQDVNHGADVPVEDIGLLVAELAALEPTEPALRALGEALVEQVLGLLAGGELSSAASLVRRTLLLLDEDLGAPIPGREALRAALAELFGDRHRLVVAGSLTRGAEIPNAKESLFTLLTVLDARQLDAFTRLAALVESVELDQVIADSLLLAVEREEAAVVALLGAAEGTTAIAPLLALSRLRSPQLIAPATARLHDPEARVREAALRALRGQQTPSVKQAALAALADSDRRVRMEALRYLAVYRDLAHLPDLERRMGAPAFASADEAELRAWLLSYALIGRGQSVGFLRRVALREQQLPGQHPTLDALVITALGRTDSEAGRKALAELPRRRPELAELVRDPKRGS